MAWRGVEASGPRVVRREGKVKRAGSGGGGSVEGGLVWGVDAERGRWRILGFLGGEVGMVVVAGWTVTGADGVVEDFLEGVVGVGGFEGADAGSGDFVAADAVVELMIAALSRLVVYLCDATASLADSVSVSSPSALFMCALATNARPALRRSATWLFVPGSAVVLVDAAAIGDLGSGSGRAMAVQWMGEGDWPIGLNAGSDVRCSGFFLWVEDGVMRCGGAGVARVMRVCAGTRHRCGGRGLAGETWSVGWGKDCEYGGDTREMVRNEYGMFKVRVLCMKVGSKGGGKRWWFCTMGSLGSNRIEGLPTLCEQPGA